MTAGPSRDIPKPPKRECGAQRSRNRGICRVTILYPNGRCRMHGGPLSANVGPANAAYRHGRESLLLKALPKNLTYAAQEVLDNPARLEMTEHLAVLQAQLVRSLNAWDGGGDIWKDMMTAWGAYTHARGKGDIQGMTTAVDQLEKAINRGTADYLARTESRDIIETIRRVSDTERKRLIDAQLMWTADQVYLFVANIIEDINNEVTDKQMLGRLQAKFAERLGAYQERTRALAS